MKRRFDWRCVAGVALVAMVAAVILAAYSLLSRARIRELTLIDRPDERFGWSYELLVDGEARPYELAFEEGAYTPSMPKGTQAVRIERAMTEEIPHAELEWYSYLDGVEVFLDGELLHTDFSQDAPRGADGFLRPTQQDWDHLHRAQGDVWKRVRMTLPADYPGKTLCVITYFPGDWGIPMPEYPILGNDESNIAFPVTYAVKSDAVMTIYALLALVIAGMFLLDTFNDGADAKVLLLSLYFLLMFFDAASASYAGYYSQLSALNLGVLYVLYVSPLYLYLALRLRSRWRVPLSAAVLAWTLYEFVRGCLELRSGVAGSTGPESLAVLLLVAAAYCASGVARGEWNFRDRRRAATYAIAAAVITIAYLLGRFRMWGGALKYLRDGIWVALRMGNFEPVVSLATNIVSTLALLMVVLEFARRTLRTRQEMSVLQDRARQTMEGYERLLAAESATSALHHEMRHHMTALSGILESGDVERARRYADAVAGDLDRLPAGRYSQNLLVDVIAGCYLDRAWARQIQVEHRLNVPPELHIADEDLSVFLSNMLQNALEACERMDAAAKRYIRVEMRLRGNFLFIHCVNSAADAAGEKEDRPGHGYGLAAMRRVAEKYNSALVIERAPGEFSVMSDLCLRGAKRTP